MTVAEAPHEAVRRARLVLVTRAGAVVGALPPFVVDVPWWPDAQAVVAGAQQRYRIDVVVLRLLSAELPAPAGGLVTYLAEVDLPLPAGVGTTPWDGRLDDSPLRQSWARPGGPAADIAWADAALARLGLTRSGPPHQVRTWNLSSLWWLPVGARRAWLKVVPPFFGHEGPLLDRLAGAPVPTVLAQDGARTLMREVPGEDRYSAEGPVLERMVRLLVGIQAGFVGGAEELLDLGLPDQRGPALAAAIADVVDRTAVALSAEDRTTLSRFVDALPERIAGLADTGVPDTLVHGDFHAGNLRGPGESVVLLDWGDSGVGCPLLDQSAFLDRLPQHAVEPLRALWRREWIAAVPGCDVRRAERLVGPVAAARQAVVYQRFLDRVEPSERIYHRGDPARWLASTARLVRES